MDTNQGRRRWDDLGDWDWHTIDSVYKQVMNENLSYSSGSSTQMLCGDLHGKEI